MYSTTIKFNTEPILSEIDNVIKNGLTKLLSEHLNRYELLEKTHQAIMSLPSVLSELNNPYSNNLDIQFQEKEKEKEKENENAIDTKTIMLFTENIVKIEVNKQYESIIPLFEKMLTKIENLTNEVNELKNKTAKNIIDLTINEEVPLWVEPDKPEFIEKENIKLEIEETTEFELENDSEESVVEEIPAGTKLGGKTWDGDDWETDDEYEVEEEEEKEEKDKVVVEEEKEEKDKVVVEDEEEVVEEDVVEEEVVEEEVVEEEVVEEEVVVEEEDDEVETEKSESEDEKDEEEFFEIDIDDVTYCTNDEENGFIYQLSEDGDIGTKVGYLKEGEPFFYADEN